MKWNLYDPRELPDLLRSWAPEVTPQTTPEETHRLALKKEYVYEIAARVEAELRKADRLRKDK